MCCAPTIPQKIVKNIAKKYLTDLYQSLVRIVICKKVFLAHNSHTEYHSLLKNIQETTFWNCEKKINIFDREIFFGRQWQSASQMKLEGFDFWSTKGKMHFSRYMAPLDGEALKKTLCSLKEAERHQQCLCISEHALCSQQYQINLSCFSGLAWVTFQKGGWMRFW